MYCNTKYKICLWIAWRHCWNYSSMCSCCVSHQCVDPGRFQTGQNFMSPVVMWLLLKSQVTVGPFGSDHTATSNHSALTRQLLCPCKSKCYICNIQNNITVLSQLPPPWPKRTICTGLNWNGITQQAQEVFTPLNVQIWHWKDQLFTYEKAKVKSTVDLWSHKEHCKSNELVCSCNVSIFLFCFLLKCLVHVLHNVN